MDVGGQAAAFVLGVIGPAVAALGIYLSRRGQREQRELDRFTEDYNRVKEQRDRAEAAEARLRADLRVSEDELDEQRDEYRKRLTDSESAHRAEVARLRSTLQLMHTVVHSEVAKAAAVQAIESTPVQPQPRDPVDDWLDAAPDLD